MEDLEIYDSAYQILEKIRTDLNEELYATLGNPLRLRWSHEPAFGAWAESAGGPAEPAQHTIVIRYELARQIYRDCEDFLAFARGELQEERFQGFFRAHDPYPPIPECFSLEHSTHIMFVAALTWVFFHELGHLMQEHGYIRSLHGISRPGEPFTVSDSDINSGPPLTGRKAQISHATELAADFEACFTCFSELVRQFSDPSTAGDAPDGSHFIGASYLYVCAIALVMYRFNGGSFAERPATAERGHPPPLYRLEAVLPSVYELADFDPVRTITGHRLDRRQLVQVYGRAAYGVAFFWLEKSDRDWGPIENYLPNGVLNSPPMMAYTREIISVWDEILPQINGVRRIDNPLSLMQFTDDFRARLGLIPPQVASPTP
jgi:hypothetical protein